MGEKNILCETPDAGAKRRNIRVSWPIERLLVKNRVHANRSCTATQATKLSFAWRIEHVNSNWDGTMENRDTKWETTIVKCKCRSSFRRVVRDRAPSLTTQHQLIYSIYTIYPNRTYIQKCQFRSLLTTAKWPRIIKFTFIFCKTQKHQNTNRERAPPIHQQTVRIERFLYYLSPP